MGKGKTKPAYLLRREIRGEPHLQVQRHLPLVLSRAELHIYDAARKGDKSMASTGTDLALLEESSHTFYCTRDHVYVEEVVLFKLRRPLGYPQFKCRFNFWSGPQRGRARNKWRSTEEDPVRRRSGIPGRVSAFASSSSVFAPSLPPSLKNEVFTSKASGGKAGAHSNVTGK